MKNKKIAIYILSAVLAALLFGSCAIDKKCPAYTKADAEVVNPAV